MVKPLDCLKVIIIKKTVYSNEPEKLAENFEKMGAKLLHVVDLDGAKDGECINLGKQLRK